MTTENQEQDTTFENTKDITTVLGVDMGLWYKRRLQMPEVSGKTVVITRAEWRDRDTGGYYILHITNQEGSLATVTTSSPKIKAKLSALINREAFPVKCKFVPDGETKGYDIVKGD
jgi:hypothetical protein